MEDGFWSLFAETGDPMAYLMCVSLEKAEGRTERPQDRPAEGKTQRREDMPPMPEA